jgi:uncharacterized heparinase superfamily protein
LSFEFSSSRSRIIVNCGMPSANRKAWQRVARATAAHSTAELNETSSCRFLRETRFSRFSGTPIVAGPRDVRVSRTERDGALFVRASHDGYAARYGIIHQRSWLLSRDGNRLDGEDVFIPAGGKKAFRNARDYFAIRFHLHPSVKASRLADGCTVLLVLPQQSWLFSAPESRVSVEESVFLSAADGPRRSNQIVISGEVKRTPRSVWTVLRTETPPAERREPSSGPQLPL